MKNKNVFTTILLYIKMYVVNQKTLF